MVRLTNFLITIILPLSCMAGNVIQAVKDNAGVIAPVLTTAGAMTTAGAATLSEPAKSRVQAVAGSITAAAGVFTTVKAVGDKKKADATAAAAAAATPLQNVVVHPNPGSSSPRSSSPPPRSGTSSPRPSLASAGSSGNLGAPKSSGSGAKARRSLKAIAKLLLR